MAPKQRIHNLLASDGKSITVTRGTTFDSRANLVGNLLETIVKQYVGALLGRQINAELIDDVAGALWTRRLLDLFRRADAQRLRPMQRIVVTVDPASNASNEQDRTSETELIVAGLGRDERGYGLDDLSYRLSPRMTPASGGRPWWSKSTWAAPMVEAVLRAERAGLPGQLLSFQDNSDSRRKSCAGAKGRAGLSRVLRTGVRWTNFVTGEFAARPLWKALSSKV